jgi:hypothetical protein
LLLLTRPASLAIRSTQARRSRSDALTLLVRQVTQAHGRHHRVLDRRRGTSPDEGVGAGLTDTLVDLLIATVHRISARAERKITEELIREFTRVTGKEPSCCGSPGRRRPPRRYRPPGAVSGGARR